MGVRDAGRRSMVIEKELAACMRELARLKMQSGYDEGELPFDVDELDRNLPQEETIDMQEEDVNDLGELKRIIIWDLERNGYRRDEICPHGDFVYERYTDGVHSVTIRYYFSEDPSFDENSVLCEGSSSEEHLLSVNWNTNQDEDWNVTDLVYLPIHGKDDWMAYQTAIQNNEGIERVKYMRNDSFDSGTLEKIVDCWTEYDTERILYEMTTDLRNLQYYREGTELMSDQDRVDDIEVITYGKEDADGGRKVFIRLNSIGMVRYISVGWTEPGEIVGQQIHFQRIYQLIDWLNILATIQNKNVSDDTLVEDDLIERAVAGKTKPSEKVSEDIPMGDDL